MQNLIYLRDVYVYMLPLQKILLLDFGFAKVPSWGLMVAIAICLAGYVSYRESKRLNLDFIIWRNSSILLLVFGLIGMRLFRFFRDYSFVSIEDAIYELFVYVSLDSVGGVLGVVAVLLYLRSKQVDVGKYIDSYALSGAVLIIFARFGCLLALDEMGTVTSVAWGVFYDGAIRHPVALYYIMNGLFVFVLLSMLTRKKVHPYPGFLMNTFFIAFPLIRGLIDFFRETPPTLPIGLDIIQIAYFVVALVSGVIMYIRIRRH